MNNDSKLDIVLANNGDVSVALGNGDGTFATQVSYSDGGITTAGKIQLGDINGDGNIDVIAGGLGFVSVMLGAGNGSFNQVQTFATATTGGASVGLALADIDGDGAEDILSVGRNGVANSFLSILRGNGDGTFQAATSIDTGIGYANSEIAVRDINGDGVVDVAVGAGWDVSILLNNGNGTFGTPSTFQQLGGSDIIGDIQLADINGDGIDDLIATSRHVISVVAGIRIGNGDGTFQEVTSHTGLGVSSGTDTLAVGDVNNDGVLDILTSSLFNSTLFVGESEDGINPILDFSLTTQADALQALAPLTRKLDELSAQRGIIGAFQSRLNSALSVLSTKTENSAAAESRIRDADIASETSNLTRLTILQQAASAVLSQANIQPALAIQLLR